jgi:hypothetical protein
MIFDFFTDLFDLLNRQYNNVFIMLVYLGVAAGVVLLRIMAKVRFGAALLAFRQDARDLTNRDDLKKFKNALLRRTVAAYKQVADKAVSRIPTIQIIERHVEGLRVAGWRFGSLAAFVEGIESGLLWVGVLLALIFTTFAHVYGVLAIAVFILIRFFTAVFDFRAARAALCDEMFIYIEREVGRFYVSDSGGAVLRLKNELTEAQNRQSQALTAALERLTVALTENNTQLGKTIAETTKGINTQIAEAIDEKLINMNADLTKSSEAWQKALTEAAAIQAAMNHSASGVDKASGKLQSASELLATHLQGHSNALSDQLTQLVRAVTSVKEAQEALALQSHYIEKNQSTLETALAAYEASLQNITQSLGDGIGAFINLHAQTSAQAVNDALRGNLEKIMQLSQRTDAT